MNLNKIEEFLRDLERELEFLDENDTVSYYRSGELSVKEKFMDSCLQELIDKASALTFALREEANNKQ